MTDVEKSKMSPFHTHYVSWKLEKICKLEKIQNQIRHLKFLHMRCQDVLNFSTSISINAKSANVNVIVHNYKSYRVLRLRRHMTTHKADEPSVVFAF